MGTSAEHASLSRAKLAGVAGLPGRTCSAGSVGGCFGSMGQPSTPTARSEAPRSSCCFTLECQGGQSDCRFLWSKRMTSPCEVRHDRRCRRGDASRGLAEEAERETFSCCFSSARQRAVLYHQRASADRVSGTVSLRETSSSLAAVTASSRLQIGQRGEPRRHQSSGRPGGSQSAGGRARLRAQGKRLTTVGLAKLRTLWQKARAFLCCRAATLRSRLSLATLSMWSGRGAAFSNRNRRASRRRSPQTS